MIADWSPPEKLEAIKAAVAQGGIFDFQRCGDEFFPAYTNASNYAVGFLMHAAAFSEVTTDAIGGYYASQHSQTGWTLRQTTWWNNGWSAANQNKLPEPPQNTQPIQVDPFLQ